jgi:hypothetical protein
MPVTLGSAPQPAPATPPRLTGLRLRTRFNLPVSRTYVIETPGGEILEVDIVVMLPGQWRRRPEASPGSPWRTLRIGPLILGIHFEG